MLRIIGLGDSTTAGTPGFRSPIESPPNGEGDTKSQYAYWVMKKHPEWEVLNRGVNGERSDQILGRFERDVEKSRAKFVVILAGVNDIYQGYPVDFTEANLRETYQKSSSMGSTPLACSVLPYNTMGEKEATKMKEINDWISREAKSRRIGFVDTSRAVAREDRPDRLLGSPDGLHPDVEGYHRMGDAISGTIEDLLGIE